MIVFVSEQSPAPPEHVAARKEPLSVFERGRVRREDFRRDDQERGAAEQAGRLGIRVDQVQAEERQAGVVHAGDSGDPQDVRRQRRGEAGAESRLVQRREEVDGAAEPGTLLLIQALFLCVILRSKTENVHLFSTSLPPL